MKYTVCHIATLALIVLVIRPAIKTITPLRDGLGTPALRDVAGDDSYQRAICFAPVFSSQAIPAKIKATLLIMLSCVLAPAVAALPGSRPEIGVSSIAGEMIVGLVFGETLSLLTEVVLLAGQLVGMQFSFSLVNLLDPNSQIQTTLFGQLFNILLTTLLVTAGLHRTLLAALLRSFGSVPVGTVLLTPRIGPVLLAMTGGVFLAALQLSAPVMAMTVPAKTVLGYLTLIGSLALWPAFLEARFSRLLDAGQTLLR